MAVPRPVLLALLGVALCAAAFLATRGARDPGGAVTSVPAPAPAPAPAPKAKTPADPQPQKPAEPGRNAAQPKPDPAPAKRDPAPAKPSVKPAAPATSGPLDGIRSAAQAAANPGAAKPAAPRPAASVASRVKAAFAADHAVVFLFTRPGAADDVGTRQSVEALKGVDRVTVVKAGLSDLDDFGPVLAGAGVSQVPSVVIARKDRPARLLEGYVDRGSLRQNVADALR